VLSDAFQRRILSKPQSSSTPTGIRSSRRFDELVLEAQITIEPVTEAQARIAREAYRDFGRGSGHRAKLNFGDCFAYALAKVTGEPLLFKGDDFAKTDIKVV
jgi:ribonuclease VapC